MGVVIIDGSTVRDFVNDESQFMKTVDELFESLDLNKDGVLSRNEIKRAFASLRLIDTHFGEDVATSPEDIAELYNSIFERFDYDKSGGVDINEYRAEVKKIMLAIADGLGSSPIQMVLEEDDGTLNLLQKAADLEAAKATAAAVSS